jgi:hypothetical protein
VGELGWYKNCLVMVSNPVQPYLALGRDDGIVDFIHVFAPDNPKILCALNLCKEGISDIQFSQQGNYVVACAVETGLIFVAEVLKFSIFRFGVLKKIYFSYISK